ncbi:MAG: bifunctional UDP-N-acetylglucosamine diphosphorylase/glucosamine-1-phosphate N-acetyltransferase GlmU [Roseburia sp.]|nr:bifunctional UDP-N-acetylglucosamine diphosphorylase/glucosamine-1-phosphate N-acetyltransferase GlmU [Anaeroplasma bactoclasticum]MCM1195982.1 bifunctional UDP-N-acetylglucosamine diphosphorylase/glucosamine-1-phosphate N-acetyltransferase GlmU [Roseburia sp.]MCM1556406.1 bifunctional UDP-N-acetylglucosamine diphosphorylase/glucosamine-1-phosphate N-acetyltransferase GlmU [Anaeroplasma bactoclasticum]
MDFAIILATENGMKMHSSKAKSILPILGKPMINYILDALFKTSLKKIICVLGNQYSDFNLPSCVDIVLQEKQLGTADAVKTALPRLICDEGDVLILPGDVPFITSETIEEFVQFHKNNNNLLTIGTIRFNSPFGYGRVIRGQNQIVRIVEEKDASVEEKQIREVYSGFMCVNTTTLKKSISQIEYYLTDLVEIVSKIGKVDSYEIKDKFEAKGINDLYSLSLVEQEFQRRILKKHMLKGVYIENANTVTIGPDVSFLGEVTVYSGTRILGHSIIYPKTILGPNTDIKDSVLYPGVKASHSVIYDSCIGKNTTVGPFAHIRNNSYIGEANRIGNFVEFKNTTTGYKTYASHLSYVGDTNCGSGVNFGCGIITVNYDGKKKYTTTIGDNVFIGCNSNLIAPIEIGSNSYIASGSTIVDGLNEGDFAIARAKQITKSSYADKYKYKRVDKN